MDASRWLKGRTNVLLAVAALALGLGGVGLASVSALHAPAAVNRAVPVTVNGGKLVFPAKALPAGKVTFVATNKGKAPGAFAAMGLGLNKRTPAIPPGKSSKLTVTLKPGTYHFWDPVQSTMGKAVYLPVRKAVDVTVANGKLTFSTKTLPAGKVLFVVTNTGKTNHGFAAMGTGLRHLTHGIQPGTSAIVMITLKQGTYHFWDPVRSTMAKAVFLSVKGSGTGTSGSTGGSTGGGSTGGGGGFTPSPSPSPSPSPAPGGDMGHDGCDH
jgi:uncharacterized membrane protein YgcG